MARAGTSAIEANVSQYQQYTEIQLIIDIDLELSLFIGCFVALLLAWPRIGTR